MSTTVIIDPAQPITELKTICLELEQLQTSAAALKARLDRVVLGLEGISLTGIAGLMPAAHAAGDLRLADNGGDNAFGHEADGTDGLGDDNVGDDYRAEERDGLTDDTPVTGCSDESAPEGWTDTLELADMPVDVVPAGMQAMTDGGSEADETDKVDPIATAKHDIIEDAGWSADTATDSDGSDAACAVEADASLADGPDETARESADTDDRETIETIEADAEQAIVPLDDEATAGIEISAEATATEDSAAPAIEAIGIPVLASPLPIIVQAASAPVATGEIADAPADEILGSQTISSAAQDVAGTEAGTDHGGLDELFASIDVRNDTTAAAHEGSDAAGEPVKTDAIKTDAIETDDIVAADQPAADVAAASSETDEGVSEQADAAMREAEAASLPIVPVLSPLTHSEIVWVAGAETPEADAAQTAVPAGKTSRRRGSAARKAGVALALMASGTAAALAAVSIVSPEHVLPHIMRLLG